MFKCVRLANLRGLIAPHLLRAASGRWEGPAGHTMAFEVTPKPLSCRNPWWQVWGGGEICLQALWSSGR